MKILPLSAIKISPDRQRADMSSKEIVKHIQDLADELKTKPLLHPIVLQTETNNTLVAGECRLTAITMLSMLDIGITFDGNKLEAGYIPVTYLGELDELAYEEAELSENLNRQDLTWQQEAAAIARLHLLREKVKGIYGVGAKPREGQTPKATAIEVFKTENVTSTQVESVRDSLSVYEHLGDAEIQKAKSKKEAVRILERRQKTAIRQQLADEYVPSTPHTLLAGDCTQLIKAIPTNSIEIILTDPPYGIDMGTSWDGTEHDYDDTFLAMLVLLDTMAEEWYRVAADKAHAYVFCDIKNHKQVMQSMETAGWKVWPRPLIWYKGNIGAFPNSERGFRYTYETIIYCNKGDRETLGVPHDVICINQIQNQDHPAAKPVELYEHLLKISALPGDKVLDSFAGGGTIFPAATRTGCIAIGMEMNPTYLAMAKLRMGELS